VFGTYLLDDNVESGLTLFPLARGFRMKPAVFVFAPVWFCCCILIAYAVFLKVQETAGSGAYVPFFSLSCVKENPIPKILVLPSVCWRSN